MNSNLPPSTVIISRARTDRENTVLASIDGIAPVGIDCCICQHSDIHRFDFPIFYLGESKEVFSPRDRAAVDSSQSWLASSFWPDGGLDAQLLDARTGLYTISNRSLVKKKRIRSGAMCVRKADLGSH